MPWEIVQGDISNLSFRVDAIVNVSHPNHKKVGLGVDRAIHTQAGPELLEERAHKGRIKQGQAITTKAYGLKARFVIHTLGTYWRDGKHGEERVLRSCYDSALNEAVNCKCKKIAFPLIASGNQGFPTPNAYRVATDAFRDFCENHDMKIYLVVFDEETVNYCRRQQKIRVDKCLKDAATVITEEYKEGEAISSKEEVRRRIQEANAVRTWHEDQIDRILDQTAKKNVYETIWQLVHWAVDENGMDTGSVEAFCRKANLNEKHFYNQIGPNRESKEKASSPKGKKSKEKTPNPQRRTLLAYAFALEMSQAQITELFRRANYVFPSSSEADEILVSYLSKGFYDITTINEKLSEKEAELIGIQE